MSSIKDVLEVLAQGFAPYHGTVSPCVYDQLLCPNSRKSAWFTRNGKFLCLGCTKKCLCDGDGFQTVLPVRSTSRLLFGVLPVLSVDELLVKKRWLTPAEAAYCLGISERQIRYYADMGRVTKHADTPLRILAASVRDEMDRVEE